MARGPLALLALFAGSVLESTLLPWPIEFPLLAYMLRGRRQVVEATLVVTLGSVLGCVLSYWAGRLALDLAEAFISARPDLALSLEGARARIDAYGAWAVGVSMLTPVPVQLSSFAAGAALIPAPLFVLAAFSAGALWRHGRSTVPLWPPRALAVGAPAKRAAPCGARRGGGAVRPDDGGGDHTGRGRR